MSARDRVEAIIEKLEPRIRKRFLEIIAWVKDEQSLTELAKQLEAGAVVDLAGLDKAARALANEVTASQIWASEQSARDLGKELGTFVSFDQTNVNAVEAMARQQKLMADGFSQQQRQVVRQVIIDGIAAGDNPRTVARVIRDSIGLTPIQESHVANYERQLKTGDPAAFNRLLRDRRFDAATRRAIEEGTPLSQAQIDKMVGRYRERYIGYRAEVIARTESLRATHEGAEETWRQAVENGEVDPDTVICEWHAGTKPRTRDSHVTMNGQVRAPGEAFTSGDSIALRYPGDPLAPIEETAQCRCAVSRRIVSAKQRALMLAAA